MYYIYLIKSINFPEIEYVGYTTNLKQRLETHNSGGSKHTSKHKPWQIIMHLSFQDQTKAKKCELYLKSQSGLEHLPRKDSGKNQKDLNPL